MFELLVNTGQILGKIMFLVGLGVYAMFAVVIVRQIELMASSVVTPHYPWLKGLAVFHLGLVLFLAVVVIVWL